jgi:hypothetical protein
LKEEVEEELALAAERVVTGATLARSKPAKRQQSVARPDFTAAVAPLMQELVEKDQMGALDAEVINTLSSSQSLSSKNEEKK